MGCSPRQKPTGRAQSANKEEELGIVTPLRRQVLAMDAGLPVSA